MEGQQLSVWFRVRSIDCKRLFCLGHGKVGVRANSSGSSCSDCMPPCSKPATSCNAYRQPLWQSQSHTGLLLLEVGASAGMCPTTTQYRRSSLWSRVGSALHQRFLTGCGSGRGGWVSSHPKVPTGRTESIASKSHAPALSLPSLQRKRGAVKREKCRGIPFPIKLYRIPTYKRWAELRALVPRVDELVDGRGRIPCRWSLWLWSSRVRLAICERSLGAQPLADPHTIQCLRWWTLL